MELIVSTVETAIVPGHTDTQTQIHRIRLPSGYSTPAAARAFVESILAENGLTSVLDQARLLTAELSTNVVRHTGTNLDLEVATDPRGVTVTVADHTAGALTSAKAVKALGVSADGGYGLMLVDRFSHSWGINHYDGGKAVWFRLEPHGAAGPAPASFTGSPDATLAAAEALIQIDPGHGEPAAEFAQRLLESLCEWLPAGSGQVQLDRGDGAGVQVLASFGPPADGDLRVPLPVSRPWSGEIVLQAVRSANGPALARLAAERLGLALERQQLKLTDLRRRAWLTFLAEASELLAQSLDPELTTALIPRLVVPRLGSWCAVYNVDETGEFHLAAATHSDEAELAKILSILDETVGKAGISDEGWFTPLPPPIEGFTIPLDARGQRLGLLAVGRLGSQRADPDELGVVGDLARRAALAIDNARIHHERRRIAHALQQSLLPPELPQLAGLELGAQYVPMGDDVDVGGDFYDVLPMPDGRWLLVVGDVSGKGIQAANVTGLVRDVIRVLIRDGRPIDAILDTLNEMLYERGGRYCTLALATVNPENDGEAGSVQLSLHLAGHDKPVLVRADGSVSEVGTGGIAVGLLKELSSPESTVTLGKGDAIVFYTDGVTERRRYDEFFGTQRLQRTVAEFAGYPSEVIAARLSSTVLGFSSEPPRDDIAILVLRNL